MLVRKCIMACKHFTRITRKRVTSSALDMYMLYVLVHRCVYGRTSPLLKDMFISRQTSCTNSETRSQNTFGLALPSVSTRYGLSSLSFLAADRWNALPADIRTTAAAGRFRSDLSKYLGYPVRRQ